MELSTDFLYTIQSSGSDGNIRQRISSALKLLHTIAEMNVLVVAVNTYTYPEVLKLSRLFREFQNFSLENQRNILSSSAFAKSSSLFIIGADLFRAHYRRPGLFSAEDISSLTSLTSTIHDLNCALDTCMKLERKYIEQV